MESNLPSHYNYSFDQATNSYIFITKKNIIYRVAFIVDETLNTITDSKQFDGVYQIIIEKVTEEIDAFDARVAKTIDHLISDFFSIEINALIYVCTDTDDKGIVRFKVFDRWYRQSTTRTQIGKIDTVISYSLHGKTEEIHSSLLYHHANPRKGKFVKAYQKIKEMLDEEK